MKILRSKRKFDPHTQRSGLPMTDYNSYNTHFWRFETNIFHCNIVRLNNILKDLSSCKEDHDILDIKCALIHSENEWATVTRSNWQKKDQQQPVNLKALPLEKKIQSMLSPPPTIDSPMNNEKMWWAREHNKCRIILDSGASINIFYNKNLIENVQYIDNPHEVTTGGCMTMEYDQVGMLTSLLHCIIYHYQLRITTITTMWWQILYLLEKSARSLGLYLILEFIMHFMCSMMMTHILLSTKQGKIFTVYLFMIEMNMTAVT